jgi:hypothetical protein
MTTQLSRDPAHRITTSFVVRFRPFGESRTWWLGRGINISRGGLCFCSTAPAQPCIGQCYELCLTVSTSCGHQETIRIKVKVRWYAKGDSGITIGLRVADSSHQQILARAVARLYSFQGDDLKNSSTGKSEISLSEAETYGRAARGERGREGNTTQRETAWARGLRCCS